MGQAAAAKARPELGSRPERSIQAGWSMLCRDTGRGEDAAEWARFSAAVGIRAAGAQGGVVPSGGDLALHIGDDFGGRRPLLAVEFRRRDLDAELGRKRNNQLHSLHRIQDLEVVETNVEVALYTLDVGHADEHVQDAIRNRHRKNTSITVAHRSIVSAAGP